MGKTEPYFDQNKTVKSGSKHAKIIKTQNETMNKIQENSNQNSKYNTKICVQNNY